MKLEDYVISGSSKPYSKYVLHLLALLYITYINDKIFQKHLQVIEPQGNKVEKILNSEIGLAVGVAVHEFDEMKDSEVQDFRRNIMQVCKECMELRDLGGMETQALFAYPPEVESKSTLPASIERKLDRGEIILCIWQLAKDGYVS